MRSVTHSYPSSLAIAQLTTMYCFTCNFEYINVHLYINTRGYSLFTKRWLLPDTCSRNCPLSIMVLYGLYHNAISMIISFVFNTFWLVLYIGTCIHNNEICNTQLSFFACNCTAYNNVLLYMQFRIQICAPCWCLYGQVKEPHELYMAFGVWP